MKTIRKYKITFGNDVKSLEMVYGGYSTIIDKGTTRTINEDTYKSLLMGNSVRSREVLGHGIVVGYEYGFGDISEIVEIKTTERVVLKKSKS